MKNGASSQWNSIENANIYGTRHYLVSHIEMLAILESLKLQKEWDISDTQGLASASTNLGKGQWLRFSFFRINEGKKYIMEGEGALLSERKWRQNIPSEVKKVMVAKKPISYSRFRIVPQLDEEI